MKPREFWLAFTEDDRLSAAVLREPFPTDFAAKLGMPFEEIHVREVSPEYDKAVEGLVASLEWYAEQSDSLFSEAMKALEAWRKVNGEA